MVNLQTLFGKDYYVILRPSLCFEFKYNNNSTNLTIIILSIIIVLFFIISIGIILLKYRKDKLKNNKDDTLLSNAELNLIKI
jgi:predicted permease